MFLFFCLVEYKRISNWSILGSLFPNIFSLLRGHGSYCFFVFTFDDMVG